MKKLLTYLLFTSLTLCFNKVNSTNYYFSSSSGDDSRTSTQAQSPATPWKSIDKLNSFFSSLQPGDSILFKRGDVFYGSITVNKSGSSNAPITFGAYDSGPNPIITGSTTLSTWTSLGNGIYQADLNTEPKIVTVGGIQYPPGRYPKTGWLNIDNTSGNTITSSGLSGQPNYAGANVVTKISRYEIGKYPISSQSATTITFSGGSARKNFGFFVTNSFLTLTSYGDWFYDNSSQKLKVFFGSSTSDVQVSSIDQLLSIIGKSNINILNIDFNYANDIMVHLQNTDNIHFNNCNFSFVGNKALLADANSNTNLSITNCSLKYINNVAIHLYGTNNDGLLIQNNVFSNIGSFVGEGANDYTGYSGVIMEGTASKNAVISNNVFDTIGFIAIRGGAQNSLIKNNFINYFCFLKDDGGGIYVQEGTAQGKRITGNIIMNGIGSPDGTDAPTSRQAKGIYSDGGNAYTEIDHNSITNCNNDCIYMDNSHDINIHDNTCFATNGHCIAIDYTGMSPITNLRVTNNIEVNATTSLHCFEPQNQTSGPSLSTWGVIDSNYYARPLSDTKTIYSWLGSGSGTEYTLAQWQPVYNYDAHSKKSPKTITDVNDLRFEYNATTQNKTINLGATYIGIDSTIYPGTITLAPYTSTVLIYLSGTVANQPPVANAGPDQNFFLPTNSTTLNGSGTDADGTIASYSWTKIAGPSQFSIVSPSQAQTTINNLIQGTYQFQLTVTDNLGATGKDTVVITVNAAANQPPVANAGPDQNITLPTNSVTVSGSGNDPDGSIASYMWTKISGPTQFTIVSPTQAQTTINNLVQGTYQFQLTVTDNVGATAKDTVVITVNATNQPPTANAGPDQSISLPTDSITLFGSGNDPDGNIASYQWAKISGPTQFTIATPTQAQTIVNSLTQGVYQFQLTVTDNQGATGKDTVVITVNASNQPPTANAGPNQNITLPTDSVTLLGSGNDPDGTIVSYEWTETSGPSQFNIVSSSEAQTVINNLAQGTYQFQLTVTDNQGATGTSTVTVTVNAAPNQSPIADAGPDQIITLPTNSITLSGSGTDPDGTITSYRWRKISGPNSGNISSVYSATTTVTGLIQGVYQYELRVRDNSGAYGRDTMQVTVNAANIAPTADAGPNQNITLPTDSVTVSGSGNDPDGTIVSYTWTEISGPTQFTIADSSKAQTVINNLVQGTYQFQLTVTDNSGATGSDIVVITVNASANQAPVADAGPNQTITLPKDSLTLIGSGTDVDGTIASYQWSKVSGPSQYNIVSPSQAQTVINNLVQGTYQFQLTVTDNLGATGIDIVVVTVNAAPNIPPVADAGSDQSITLPTNTVTLVGSGNDSDGTIVSYQWTKIAGPSQFTIISPSQAQTVIDNLVQGTYQFQLTVTDNSGATGTSVVTITVNPAPNQPPTANAGTDITINLPTNSVTLSGSGWDPDGNIAAYQWTKISGPSQYSISYPTHAQTVVNNLAQGTYQFQLTVTDNEGATGTDTMKVTVNLANIAPTANAGPDESITLPANSITLFGSGNDPDGNITSYRWTKIAGPSQYNIVSRNQAQTTINNLVQGTYQFQLTVTDNLGATGKDTVQITVNPENIAPTANAGPDRNITLPINSVTLSGSGWDPDGNIVAYQWAKISGPTQFTIVSATQAQTTINNLVQGVYQFQLTVTDNLGATGTDIVTITVNPPVNQPPTANAGPDRSITLPTNSVTLTGSGSDPDGTIASYQWSRVSGPNQFTVATPFQAQTVVSNLVQGVYKFQLMVTDNLGATATDTVTVTVNSAVNLPPTANAGADQTITLPVNSVTLSGSGNDPDGTIIGYQWARISGPTQFSFSSAFQAQTNVNNLVQGVYQFLLTVTDNLGATGKDTVTVTVNAAPVPPQPPVANAGVDQTITLPASSVTLSGSGTDPDGTIVSYQWRNISGPAQFNISTPTQAKTTVNNLVQGVYEFELSVTDNSGMSAADTVEITVLDETAESVSVSIYPNPATDYINLEITGAAHTSTANLVIYNSAGEVVYTEQFSRTQGTMIKQVNIGGLVSGIYFVALTFDNSIRKTLQFIKQ